MNNFANLQKFIALSMFPLPRLVRTATVILRRLLGWRVMRFWLLFFLLELLLRTRNENNCVQLASSTPGVISREVSPKSKYVRRLAAVRNQRLNPHGQHVRKALDISNLCRLQEKTSLCKLSARSQAELLSFNAQSTQPQLFSPLKSPIRPNVVELRCGPSSFHGGFNQLSLLVALASTLQAPPVLLDLLPR